jgi:hypothetical protein
MSEKVRKEGHERDFFEQLRFGECYISTEHVTTSLLALICTSAVVSVVLGDWCRFPAMAAKQQHYVWRQDIQNTRRKF